MDDLPENCCRSRSILAPRHLRIFWHPSVWKDASALERSWHFAHKVRWCASGLAEQCGEAPDPANPGHGEDAYLDKGTPFRQSVLSETAMEPSTASHGDQMKPAGGESDVEVDESGMVTEVGGGHAPPSLADVKQLCESCSVVVALHADQAAEATVAYAVEQGKAFAVVPCCVYSEDFPNRRLPNGRAVRSLADLIDYLTALAGDGVQVGTLPFNGKNTVIYWRGTSAKPDLSVNVCEG